MQKYSRQLVLRLLNKALSEALRKMRVDRNTREYIMDMATGTDDLNTWEVADGIEYEIIHPATIRHLITHGYDPSWSTEELADLVDRWVHHIVYYLGDAYNFAPEEGPIKINKRALHKALVFTKSYDKLAMLLNACVASEMLKMVKRSPELIKFKDPKQYISWLSKTAKTGRV